MSRPDTTESIAYQHIYVRELAMEKIKLTPINQVLDRALTWKRIKSATPNRVFIISVIVIITPFISDFIGIFIGLRDIISDYFDFEYIDNFLDRYLSSVLIIYFGAALSLLGKYLFDSFAPEFYLQFDDEEDYFDYYLPRYKTAVDAGQKNLIEHYQVHIEALAPHRSDRDSGNFISRKEIQLARPIRRILTGIIVFTAMFLLLIGPVSIFIRMLATAAGQII